MDTPRRSRRFRARPRGRRAGRRFPPPPAAGRLALAAALLAALTLQAGPAGASERAVLGELFSADG